MLRQEGGRVAGTMAGDDPGDRAGLEVGGGGRESTRVRVDEVHAADEVFLTGNFNKVTRVTRFDDTHYKSHKMADRARALYWDWAASNG